MRSYGWRIDKKKFDWKTLVRNKNKELKRLNLIYFNLLKKSKVEIFNHNAEFIDEKTLLVGEFIIKAKKILIAVGTKPKKLGICSQKSLITSDDAFNITKLPKNILILGGGYIAVEFASIFNGLGVNTTICICHLSVPVLLALLPLAIVHFAVCKVHRTLSKHFATLE